MSAEGNAPKTLVGLPPPRALTPPKDVLAEEEQAQAVEAEAELIALRHKPLIEGYMPAGRIHLLGASPSAGKSSISAQLIHSLRTPVPFFGLPTNQKEVYGVFTDRCAESCFEALEAMGATDIPHVSLVNSPPLLALEQRLLKKNRDPLWGIEFFEATLAKLNAPRGAVIISDVHTNAFLGNIGNQNTLGAYMRHTAALCVTMEYTLIIVCYGVKIVGDQGALYRRLVDRIIGAASLRGSADTMMYLCTPQETGRGEAQQFQIISRKAPPKDFMLVNRGGVFYEETAEEAMVRVSQTPTTKKPPACMVMLPHVPGRDTSFEEIVEAYEKQTGQTLQPSSASTWLKGLLDRNLIENPKRGFWRRRES